MVDIIESAISFKVIPFFIPLLFYFLGVNTKIAELKKLIDEKKSFIYGLTLQIIFLPLIGIATSRIFSSSIFSGVVALALFVPGGHVSALLTHIKKGNIALSVGLTSVASFLSPFTIVLWLNFFVRDNQDLNINFVQTFLQLLILVFIPFISGVYVLIKRPTFANSSSKKLDVFLKVAILTLSFTGPFEIREVMLDNFFEGFKVALFSLVCITLVNIIASKSLNITKKNMQTITIEGFCQNFPIVVVLGSSLNMPELIVYGVIYYLVSMVFSVSYAFLKNI